MSTATDLLTVIQSATFRSDDEQRIADSLAVVTDDLLKGRISPHDFKFKVLDLSDESRDLPKPLNQMELQRLFQISIYLHERMTNGLG